MAALPDRADAERVRRQTWLILAGAVVVYGLLRWSFGPWPQDAAYHLLADTRTCLGVVPRAGDVLTNAAILAAGLFGAALRRRMVLAPEEHSAANVLIVGAICTAFGSAYYHWAPSNATLVWDRLPMTIVLIPVFALVLADRVSPLFGRYALWPFTAFAAASVIFWGASEALGQGDLGLYVVVRVGTAVGIALLLILRAPAHTGTKWLVAALVAEVALTVCERFDHEIFRMTGGRASGHNLKHVIAGLGLASVFWWLRSRRRLPVNP